MVQPPNPKKGPRWQIPRAADQRYPMVANQWLNSRPRFVLAFFISRDAAGNEISRTATEMHLADAERVVREFPHEWSRFPSAAAEAAESVAPPVEPPTALERLVALERDVGDLQARLASTRREILQAPAGQSSKG